jgi:hypothetical protein
MTDDATVYAYPVPLTNRGRGMTLRDYFASQVIASIHLFELTHSADMTLSDMAADSYRIADAMLIERQKPHA